MELSILNGNDRAFTLRALKKCIAARKGASAAHLRAVERSLNPAAARSRASKGASAMAQKHHKKAAPKKGHRINTTYEGSLHKVGTSNAPRGSGFKSKVASASKRAVSNLKGVDFKGVLIEGVGVGIGLVGTRLAEKGLGKFLPAFVPAAAKPLIAGAAVAGVSLMIGGSKGITRTIAAAAIGQGLFGLANTMAPTLLAGTDDNGTASGYWDPQTGQWIGTGQMAGVTYDPSYPLPNTSPRPAGW